MFPTEFLISRDRSGKRNPSTLISLPFKSSVFHGPIQVDWLHKGSFISLEHSLSSVSPPGILPQVLSASCLRKHAAHPEPAPQILDISREHSVSGQFLLFTWDCRDGSHGITQQLSHSLGRYFKILPLFDKFWGGFAAP